MLYSLSSIRKEAYWVIRPSATYSLQDLRLGIYTAQIADYVVVINLKTKLGSYDNRWVFHYIF